MHSKYEDDSLTFACFVRGESLMMMLTAARVSESSGIWSRPPPKITYLSRTVPQKILFNSDLY